MSLQAPMSRIPRGNGLDGGSAHKRTISAPSKLEQMQMALQARIEKEKQTKLAKDKEERMLQVYREEQERQNRQISKYGYNDNGYNNSGHNDNLKRVPRAQPGANVGGVRDFFQGRRQDPNSAGKGLRGKPPLPHQQKNSAGRDRGNPLAPINLRSPHNDVGVLGQGSPTGIRQSPKLLRNRANVARNTRGGPYGTPNDSGNESSGYEDQNQNYRAKNTSKLKRPQRLNQYQASSEEDVNGTPPGRKPSSFQQWKQEMNNNPNKTYKIPKSTAIHNGYHSDSGAGQATDFQKWQGEMDRQKQERLERHRQERQDSNPGSPMGYGQEETPSSYRSRGPPSNRQPPPSTRRRSQPSTVRYEDSAGEEEDSPPPPASNRSNVSKISSAAMERNAKLEGELKRKERELLDMIQKQQDQLESMKQQRAREEAEEERDKKERAQEQERKRKARLAEERARQHSRQSSIDEPKHMPSPPPADLPKPFARKARRVKPPPARKQPPPPPTQDDEPSFYNTSNTADIYVKMAQDDPDAAPVQLHLVPCGMCGRKFAEERLAKHQVACEKTQAAAAKRKTFDTTKHRTEGTELAQYVNNPRPEPKKKKTADWRKKHEEFVNSIRYARKVTEVEKAGGNVADLPPPPRTENAHYKQCPYCERRFAPDTAERHIPKCKDMKSRPKPINTRKR